MSILSFRLRLRLLTLALLLALLLTPVLASAQSTITFLDSNGEPVSDYLEGSVVFVRLQDPLGVGASMLNVNVSSTLADDLEFVDLFEVETPGVFEGRIDLDPGGLSTQGDQRLQTSIDLGPPAVHETVTVDYGGSTASINLRGASAEFVDDLGYPTPAFAMGMPVFVRVIDYRVGDPTVVDSFPLDVFLVSDPAVRRTAWMTETGKASGVFQGSVENDLSFPWAGLFEEIRVQHLDADGLVVSDSALIQASVVNFVDDTGRPVDAYREGSRAFLRISDPAVNVRSDFLEWITTEIQSIQGNDHEWVLLVETRVDSGIFEGSIDLGVGMSLLDRLETLRLPGSPPSFDTIVVDYFDSAGYSSDSADMLGASVAFVDEAGLATGRYARDTTARIRLEGVNLAGGRETAQVTLTSSSGDTETVTLRETGLDNGVFEGAIGIRDPLGGGPDAGWIQAAPSDTLTVSFQDGDLTPNGSALVEPFGIAFVDEEGRPLDLVLEGGFARVRLTAIDNLNWVDLVSLEGQDWEISSLRPAGARMYEATIDLVRGMSANFGVLETWQSDAPPAIADDVAAFYSDGYMSGTQARVRTSRLALLDTFGREVTDEYLGGDDVRVRLADFNRDTDSAVRETVDVTVRSSNGDAETLQLVETDFATGLFEGTLPGQIDPSSAGDGVLGYQDGLLEVAYANQFGAAESTVRARVRESLVYVLGEDGMPAETFLQGSEARIMLVQKAFKYPLTIDFDEVNVLTELGGDEENVLLTETGYDTNVFTATVPLVLQAGATPYDGVVQVSEAPGQTDAVVVRHFEDSYGMRTVQFEALGSTVSFIDDTGLETDAFASGTALHVRVVDPSSNTAGQVDTTSVTVQSLVTGDSETLTLTETDAESGVFEGSASLEAAAAQPGDGLVQALDLEHLEASHTNASGLTTSTARAEIRKALFRIVDADGRKTDTVFEEGPLYLRAWDAEANQDPGAPDVLVATAETFFGFDWQLVTLTETGDDTGIFTGVREDGVVSANGGAPHYLDDKVVAGYTSNGVFYGDSARIVESAVELVDLFSQPVGLYAVRSEVRVRIEAPNRNDPFQVDSFLVNLSSPTGSSEDVTVVETGGDTGIFEGGIASTEVPSVLGELWVEAGQTVEVSYANLNSPSTVRLRIPFSANVVPDLMDDSAVTQQDQAVTVDVLANDQEPDSQPMFLVAVTQGTNGSVAINPDDTVTYTPGGGFLGADAFEYFVEDAEGGQARATVSVRVESPPTVTITAPADGAVVDQGDPVTFTGTATDPEDGNLSLSFAWSSNLDGAIGTGASFVTSGLSPGVHVITASVIDSDGNPASDSITLTVNGPPTVAIMSPADGSVANAGDNVTFAGTAADPEDGDLSASIAWSSSLDGALGTGASISTSALSVGVHVITASVADSRGVPASDTGTVTINGLPSVTVTAPAGGGVFLQGASVGFGGSASDPEDGDLTPSLTWTSSLDGAIGTGGSFSTAGLSLGVHVITAAVTDSRGVPASDAVSVTINAAPAVAVVAPADGTIVGLGDAVTFSGSAVDVEDGDLGANLTWTSDLDGVIGSGGSFSTTALSAGTHVVTASVTDSRWAPASDAVTVIVKVPIQVTFTSSGTEDGWVLESSETSGVGGQVADTGNGPTGDNGIRGGDDKKDKQYRGFLSFDTSTLPAGATLRSATLRLRRQTVTGTSPFTTHGNLTADVRTGAFGASAALEASDFEASATASGVAVLSDAPADGDWSEGAFDAAGLAALNPAGITQVRIAFDLDDDDDRGDDYVQFYSGDDGTAANRPQLVVKYLD